MLDLLTPVVEAAPAGTHAEARHVARTEERVLVRDGRAERVDTDITQGIGVRVRTNGAWGFASAIRRRWWLVARG